MLLNQASNPGNHSTVFDIFIERRRRRRKTLRWKESREKVLGRANILGKFLLLLLNIEFGDMFLNTFARIHLEIQSKNIETKTKFIESESKKSIILERQQQQQQPEQEFCRCSIIQVGLSVFV